MITELQTALEVVFAAGVAILYSTSVFSDVPLHAVLFEYLTACSFFELYTAFYTYRETFNTREYYLSF